MKKFVTIVALVIVSCDAISMWDSIHHQEWKKFKLEYNKKYESAGEEQFRWKIFLDNSNRIAKHNAKYSHGLMSYTLSINEYADMLHSEFVKSKNGLRMNRIKNLTTRRKSKGVKFIPPANVKLPDAVDWRKMGAVTAIKDQGMCGSCWAFSATGSLEAQHFRQTGVLISLSEQNLVDCSRSYGNEGCDGGWPDLAFEYIKNNRGIDTEKSYPYDGDDEKCRYDPKSRGSYDVGLVDLPRGDEENLKSAVATIGPVSVAIDASQESFMFYSKGIYDEPDCSTEILDHAVLSIGYGTENGKDYWLVKNSWGVTWGDRGYIKMTRNKNNQCGIASMASYPLT